MRGFCQVASAKALEVSAPHVGSRFATDGTIDGAISLDLGLAFVPEPDMAFGFPAGALMLRALARRRERPS